MMFDVYSVDTITVIRAPDPPYDDYNEPNPVTTEEITGFVTWKTELVRDLAGEEVRSSVNITMNYDGTITHEYKIRINSKNYPILAIEPLKDFTEVGIIIYLQ